MESHPSQSQNSQFRHFQHATNCHFGYPTETPPPHGLFFRPGQVHSPVDACLAASEEAQAEKEQTGLTLEDFGGPLLLAVCVCLLGHLSLVELGWEGLNGKDLGKI